MPTSIKFGKLNEAFQKTGYNPLTDPSAWAIVVGNLFAMVMAFVQKWPLHEILWIYWAQSVIIGVVNVFRIMSLKEFSCDGFKINNVQPEPTPGTKKQVAVFFAMHYGIFHAVYFVFLWANQPLNTIAPKDLMFLVICIIAFAVSHFYDLAHNLSDDFKDKKPNIGSIMFYPYLRIIPMHLTLIFGGVAEVKGIAFFGTLIFMTLKTFADVGMQIVERLLFRQKPGGAPFQMKD